MNDAPEIKSSPYTNPLHTYGSSILLMTNPNDELYKMELTFRSQYVDSEGKLQNLGEPLMNDLGISSIIGIVQSVVNRVTIFSNLKKDALPFTVWKRRNM